MLGLIVEGCFIYRLYKTMEVRLMFVCKWIVRVRGKKPLCLEHMEVPILKHVPQRHNQKLTLLWTAERFVRESSFGLLVKGL